MNSSEIKFGITSLKILRDGRVVVDAGSKQEIDSLVDKIRKKCAERLEMNAKAKQPKDDHTKYPVDITPENASENLIQQNPELAMKEGSIVQKFCHTTKRGTRNLVIEVNSEIRKKLLHNRVKIGWTVGRVDDYLVAKRCLGAADKTTHIKTVRWKRYARCAQRIIN